MKSIFYMYTKLLFEEPVLGSFDEFSLDLI
jgi:hypothetical protein